MTLALGRRPGFPADKKMSADRWRRIESLCHAALARPAEERAAFLAEACGGDASLRAEVESLLAGAEAALSFLETPIGGAPLPALVGRQLGAYRIEALIGAGGMGEVYRATDTRLGRDVALKILPPAFAADAHRRSRFEREARAVAALNHPNICTIHDVGHDQGIDFLVMELVEGESLTARLAKGPLPLDEALARAIEIADALDRAHRQGIVHRDLKPSNVMLAKNGSGKADATQAKLLDFGLARFVPSDLDSSILVARDSGRITEAGAMLGTLEYMAPEQVEGRPADARTDIFSFGALLYEMLTGRRAFEGPTTAAVMAAILREEPPPVHPREIGRIVRRCLGKDPLSRYQSARDLLNDLQEVKEAVDSGEFETGAAAPLASRRARVAWVVACAALLLAAAAGWYALNGRPADRPMVRSSLIAPEGTEFDFSEGAPALSPDGRRVAFLARRPNGARQIWVRALDSLSAQPLAGTEGATHPFWAPDGTALGFFSNLKLRRLDLSSGAIRSLCDVQRAARGGTWGPDGTILFPRSGTSEIYRVSADGGSPVAVTEFDARRDETIHRFPAFLPDGRHFLFVSNGRGDPQEPQGRNTVFVGSLDSKTRQPITWTHSSAVYSTSGHLLFLHDLTLFAQRFDVSRLALVGAPLEVAKWASATVRDEAVVSVATDAALVYQTGRGHGDVAQLAWMDRNGNQLATIGPPSEAYSVELSHDGRKVAVGVFEKGYDISVRDLERGTTAEIHFESWNAGSPVWSPDDRRLFFSLRSGTASNRISKIVSTTADGGGMQAVNVPSDGQPGASMSISSDGAVLVTTIRKESGGLGHFKHDYDIRVLALAGDAPPFLNSPEFFEMNGQLAPGTRSRWLAYQVEKSGSPEVYVQRLDREQTRVKVSTAGGSHPRWRRDGRELFYVSPDQQLMAVEITLEPQFSVGGPRSLFAAKFRPFVPFQYDVAPDGQRFLVLQAVLDEPLTLIQNWTKAFPSK